MLQDYGYIALFLLVSLSFVSFVILIPVILRFFRIVPKKPNPIKTTAFECGMKTIGRSWVQFNFRYYFYALMLIALDVMVVFVYPWAVEVGRLGVFGFIAVLVFILIIIVGYIFALKKKVLEWK
ncbi:MAG: NADH-quinone oxidoreductase subunit A [Dehalococcoidia bacterium]|nr:MAG: NADH-quinone oxidoreductase subunit A [Dehalococcoidia bacterium]